jgi:hypothetical protein
MRSTSQRSSRRKHKKKLNYHQIPMPIAMSPPEYCSQENRTWVIRGTATAAFSSSTMRTIDLAAFLGVIATAPTTCQFLCDQFRLRRVCVWAPVATAGTPVTVMLKWADDPTGVSSSGPPKTVSDTSSSIDKYAYACLEPPSGIKGATSYFTQWQDSSLTTPLVVVTAPVGSIMQFWFNWILDDIGATTSGPTIAGATAGNVYHKNIVVGGGTLQAVVPLNFI